jgi:hypothetical protein
MQRISKKRAQGMRGAVVLQSDGPNIIDIVDLAAGEVLHKIRFPYGWIVINAIASPFKTKLYVTSVSSASLHVKEYSVWDIGTAARLECPPELEFESIEMSNIGFAMVTNNFDVCDVESCTVICSCWQEEVMPRDYFGNRVGVCKFSGDDSKIIALVAKRIFVCETLSGALCYEFLGHEGVPHGRQSGWLCLLWSLHNCYPCCSSHSSFDYLRFQGADRFLLKICEIY